MPGKYCDVTPLIAHLARILPHPGDDTHWFDLGRPTPTRVVQFSDRLMHLPYQRCVLCAQDADGNQVGMLTVAGDDHRSVTMSGILTGHGVTSIIEPWALIETEGGYLPYRAGNTPAVQRELCMGLLSILTEAGSQPITGYIGTADRGYTSAKRIKAGKAPLRYTWRTVTIEPPNPAGAPQGGTHASPRAHDRRGHWRLHPSGKQVWVKACRVGNAALGSVFKDYRVSSHANQT